VYQRRTLYLDQFIHKLLIYKQLAFWHSIPLLPNRLITNKNNSTMKTLTKTIVAICFSLVAVFTKASIKPVAVKSEAQQIQSYLEKLEFNKVINTSMDVKISFTINDRNEMVILSTSQEDLDALLKQGLNYKLIDVSQLERNTTYTLPVHVNLKN
jgi:hypothetical protein